MREHVRTRNRSQSENHPRPAILKNQAALDEILANQKTILANQKAILVNQKEVAVPHR